MGHWDTDTTGAAPAVTAGVAICTGFGQSDTHKNTDRPYSTITGREIVRLVKNPPSVPKERAQWLIPSSYAASDARSHEAQRQHGEFWFLCLDVDTNNLDIQTVADALDTVANRNAWMIYATRSATETVRKWRALVPLMRPISGQDYHDTQTAFFDLLEDATQGELIPDRALSRPGQLVYLPNRGTFYDWRAVKGDRLDLTPRHPIIWRREETRRKRQVAEAEAKAWRGRKAAKQASEGGGDVVNKFNAAHDLEALMEGYGYTRAGHGKDWRSPFQTSGSYATRTEADHWISLSESDAAAGLGRPSKNGARFGDAFDLFCHFDHGGDQTAAVRAYAKEIGEDYASQRTRAEAEMMAKIQNTTPTAPPEPFFKRGSDLHGKPVPAREWLVQDLIPISTVTLLSGDGGTGKSLLALQLAIAASTGKSWVGQEVKQGTTITLSAEDDGDELHRRQADIVKAQGSTLADLGRFMYRSMAGEDALLALLDPSGKLHPTPLYHQIDQAMTAEKPVLLVLDTSADLFPGNENDRAQVRQFIGMLKKLAIKHRCAVVLLSHPSLTGINSGSGLSGSTAWNNSVRSRLYFERVLLKDGQLTIEDNPDRRVLTGKKANHARNGAELHMTWQDGVFVADQAVTGLDAMAANNKADRVFLKLLDEFASEGRFVKSANAQGNAPKSFATSGRAEGLSKQALHAAMERLFAKGAIVETLGGDGPPSKWTKRIVRSC